MIVFKWLNPILMTRMDAKDDKEDGDEKSAIFDLMAPLKAKMSFSHVPKQLSQIVVNCERESSSRLTFNE